MTPAETQESGREAELRALLRESRDEMLRLCDAQGIDHDETHELISRIDRALGAKP